MRTASDDYFDDYGPLQQYKHDLLRYYLGGWYPKLASLRGIILYLETHAGRGVHKTGQRGSPILALETLLSHGLRSRILSKCRVHFLLMEIDPNYTVSLRTEVQKMTAGAGITIQVETTDFKQALTAFLDDLENKGEALPPALVFVDPFGYDIPVDLIRRLLKQKSSEVLITFMAGPVARAMGDATKASNLDRLYGGLPWREVAAIADFEERKLRAIDLYKRAVDARWATAIRLKGQTDYALVHFTNHPDGRDLVKQAMWATAPDGNYQVFQTNDPRQLTLLTRGPDIRPLAQALRTRFANQETTHEALREWLRDTDYREPHLNEVLSAGKKEGWVITEHKGRFGPGTTKPIRVIGIN